jgi:hypothetical protein
MVFKRKKSVQTTCKSEARNVVPNDFARRRGKERCAEGDDFDKAKL